MVQTPALNVPLQARQTAMLVELQTRRQAIPALQEKITINIRVTKAGKILISKNEQKWGLPKMKVSTEGIKNDFRFHKKQVIHI